MELKSLLASLTSMPTSESRQKTLAACIALSMPHFNPAHNGLTSQRDSTSSQKTKQTVLQIIWHRVSPTPIGRIPGDLLRAIRRLASCACIDDQSKMELARRRVRSATESRRRWLWFPNLSRASCQCVVSHPVVSLILWAIIPTWAPDFQTGTAEGWNNRVDGCGGCGGCLWASKTGKDFLVPSENTKTVSVGNKIDPWFSSSAISLQLQLCLGASSGKILS